MRFWSKERGSKVKKCAKNGKVKEWKGGREERKEILADKPQDFENRPPLGVNYRIIQKRPTVSDKNTWGGALPQILGGQEDSKVSQPF